MLDHLCPKFRVLAKAPCADENELMLLEERFGSIPEELLELMREATEVEIRHDCGIYLRFWNPSGCIEMDKGYDISKRIVGALPVGDDGGGRIILYMRGKKGFGLHMVGFGDLDSDDATWIAGSLRELLVEANGIEVF